MLLDILLLILNLADPEVGMGQVQLMGIIASKCEKSLQILLSATPHILYDT